ncbi:MAG: hypothetical protein AAGA85_06460 [Bacteroidota bacterium]
MKNAIAITCIILFSAFHALAQDQLKIELKDAPKPDIYIDGVKYGYEIFDLLDQSKIESVQVIKDEAALKEYDSPNGVIVIQTKKAVQQTVRIREGGVGIAASGKDPVLILDGQVADREKLGDLKPEDIETIEVVKGQKAIDEYQAPNGVVIVKTRSSKKAKDQ